MFETPGGTGWGGDRLPPRPSPWTPCARPSSFSSWQALARSPAVLAQGIQERRLGASKCTNDVVKPMRLILRQMLAPVSLASNRSDHPKGASGVGLLADGNRQGYEIAQSLNLCSRSHAVMLRFDTLAARARLASWQCWPAWCAPPPGSRASP